MLHLILAVTLMRALFARRGNWYSEERVNGVRSLSYPVGKSEFHPQSTSKTHALLTCTLLLGKPSTKIHINT